MVNISGAMFAVAIPSIRTTFNLDADTASWLVIAHNLPFMAFIPLFGKLGDLFGKKKLFLAGVMGYILGSVLLLTAENLSTIIISRLILGAGTAGIIPLSIAVISEQADSSEQGRAMGTYNSTGPVSGILGPLVAGYLISVFPWQSIMWVVIVFGTGSIVLLIPLLPKDSPEKRKPPKVLFATFDWPGLVFFNGMVTFMVLYTSSRPITGKPPLTDLRLLAGAVVLFGLFLATEKKKKDPFIDLSFVRKRNLTKAALAVCARMIGVGGIFLVIPLMVTDLYGFRPSETGILLVFHAAAMLAATQVGGILIDRWRHRLQIVVGLLIQAAAMIIFMVLPEGVSLFSIIPIVILHGTGAGLNIAALHLFALSDSSDAETGSAAGVYSTIRYGGRLFGATFGGVLLQSGIARHGISPAAYTVVFLFYFAVLALGAAVSFGLSRKLPVSP